MIILDGLNQERKYCVYIHINKISNKAYVGQTCQSLKNRWGNSGSGYLGKDKNGEYTQPLMARAVLKYNWSDDWDHIVFADNLSVQEANHMEKLLIAFYCTNNAKYGYNIRSGGVDGTFNGPMPEERKRKISESCKGRKPSILAIEMAKLSNTGIVRSSETREKMARGKIKDKNPMWQKFGKDNPRSVAVCQCDENWNVISFYWSSHEAERLTGINSANIRAVCLQKPDKNGHIKHTAGGYKWRHAAEEEIKYVQCSCI